MSYAKSLLEAELNILNDQLEYVELVIKRRLELGSSVETSSKERDELKSKIADVEVLIKGNQKDLGT